MTEVTSIRRVIARGRCGPPARFGYESGAHNGIVPQYEGNGGIAVVIPCYREKSPYP